VTIAVNGERYVRGGPPASGSLITAHYGVQSFAPRVFPPFDSDPNQVKWWFNRASGGYLDMTAVSMPFRVRCPHDLAHPLANAPWRAPTSEALDLRRRDETWAHVSAHQHLDAAAANGTYAQAVASQRLLTGALDWMAS
jgi:hypothetical protein